MSAHACLNTARPQPGAFDGADSARVVEPVRNADSHTLEEPVRRPSNLHRNFVEHNSDEFSRTHLLLEHLVCDAVVESTTDADMVEAAAWAHDAYTDHGLHRPSSDARRSTAPIEVAQVCGAMALLQTMLAAQLIDATDDLERALRVRRALHHVRRATAANP
jgi:hypothetical protein